MNWGRYRHVFKKMPTKLNFNKYVTWANQVYFKRLKFVFLDFISYAFSLLNNF